MADKPPRVVTLQPVAQGQDPLQDPFAPAAPPPGWLPPVPGAGFRDDFGASSASAPSPPTAYSHALRPRNHPVRGPSLAFYTAHGKFQGEVVSVGMQVECNISSAFVSMEVVFRAGNNAGTAIFELPQTHRTSITDCQVRVERAGAAPIRVSTTVIPLDEAQRLASENPPPQIPGFTPDVFCFRLPVEGVGNDDTVTVNCTYHEELEFFAGAFECSVPLTFSEEQIPNRAYAERLRVTLAVNSGSLAPALPGAAVQQFFIQAVSTTHTLVGQQVGPTRSVYAVDKTQPWSNTDLIFSYRLTAPTMAASLIVEEGHADRMDSRSTFGLFLSPPSNDYIQAYFSRQIVFVIDRSGSMHGAPLEAAKRGLSVGLSMLRPQDSFNIIVFDDRQDVFQADMTAASPAALGQAQQYVEGIRCQGTTDILTPLKLAGDMLARATARAGPAAGVPFVFLLTDGAVGNERDICRYAAESMAGARILTFGVGPYCNSQFLRLLGDAARGFTDISLNAETLFDQVVHLLAKATVPILTDIELAEVGDGAGGQLRVETYPSRVPDLYGGRPVLLVGKYHGRFPDALTLRGRTPHGSRVTMRVVATSNAYVSLERVFVKTQLDQLVARAWLEDSPELRSTAVDLSVSHNTPCAYTSLVATRAEPSRDPPPDRPQRGGRGYNADASLEMIAALAAAGGALLILASAYDAFGDVAATASGASVAAALEGMSDALAFDGVGDVLSGCDCCGAGDWCQGIFGDLGESVRDACSCCGDCSWLGRLCSCDWLRDKAEDCGDCCEGWCDCDGGCDGCDGCDGGGCDCAC